jgi:Superinfection immunity protein
MATGSETLFIVGSGFYLLPTLIEAARDKTHGAAGVFLLNIFLRWTLIGWLVAFMWACSGDAPPRTTSKTSSRQNAVTGYSSALSETRRPVRLTRWMPEQARHRTPT